MHEWSLAEAVIQSALNYKKKHKLRTIDAIKIKISELQQIDIESFLYALESIAKSKGLGVKIDISKELTRLKCRVCGHVWNFSESLREIGEERGEFIHFIPEVAHVYISCPECRSHDFEILGKRGVWLESIKGTR